MNDFEAQASFVAGAVERMLHQIDLDVLSPTYGCAHLAYWRDKTSDVSDSRRQEAMLPFALLYTGDYPGSKWKGNETLFAAIKALLSYWLKSQYPDGALDEWYKGERAYAAAAFTTYAVSRTLKILEGGLAPDLESSAKTGLAKTAAWLTKRDDLFKTNHQAVGVAALAWAGHVLNDDALTRNAKSKLQSIISAQTEEGWFPEVGHMDVGYTFLTVEYAAMAMDLWNDWSQIGAFIKAFEFACQWIRPDITIGDEYGVCHNPYISRIAAILMAPHSGYAVWLYKKFNSADYGFRGYKSTLADDLRLMRWGFQPLTA